MKLMAAVTVIKVSVLLLIASIGLLVLVKAVPSDVDAGLNLSFYGTSNTVGPYASALYYVRSALKIHCELSPDIFVGYE